VTVTSTVPVPAGAVAVIDVAELTVAVVAETNPKSTVAPATKPLPVTTTDVPPAVGPAPGLTAVTAGTAATAACAQQHNAARAQTASISARRSSGGTDVKTTQTIACSPGSSQSSTIIEVPTHR
jgi:hypothetical protein